MACKATKVEALTAALSVSRKLEYRDSGIARNLEIQAIADLQAQAKVLEAEIKARRAALLESMEAEGIDAYDCGDGVHGATVVRQIRETLDRAKAEQLLHPNTLKAITVVNATTFVKVR